MGRRISPVQTPYYCSEFSLQSGEPLFGTASRVDVWLLLEVPRPWAEQAFPESALPEPVKAHLNRQLESNPRSRLLFIKQSSHSAPPFAFYLARSHETDSQLYEFRLNAYEDLLRLELPSVLAGDPHHTLSVRADPLFLVCTHGTRDKCCARFGLPAYREMRKAAPDSVWQCSHIGGDRFAANVLVLPHGLYYGRVTADDVPAIIEETRRGRIYLEHFRGRSRYSFPAQAAEHYLRDHTGNSEFAAFRMVKSERAGENQWTFLFASNQDGGLHQVEVVAEAEPLKGYLTCKAEKEASWVQYRLVGIESLSH